MNVVVNVGFPSTLAVILKTVLDAELSTGCYPTGKPEGNKYSEHCERQVC